MWGMMQSDLGTESSSTQLQPIRRWQLQTFTFLFPSAIEYRSTVVLSLLFRTVPEQRLSFGSYVQQLFILVQMMSFHFAGQRSQHFLFLEKAAVAWG